MKSTSITAVAKRIIKRIEKDITNRLGIGNEWENIDDDCKKEIREEWKRIIIDEIE